MTGRRMCWPWAVRVTVMLGMSAGLGCGATPPRPRGSTARMVDTLAGIYAQALTQPERNPFLNRRRADTMQVVVPHLSGPDAMQLRYLLAQERLLAGQSREAITELQGLMQVSGISRNDITAQTKPAFDLLAIAYLRLGEQENCSSNPSGNVCILPFTGGGLHAREEGARQATSLYQDILQRFPDDYGSRWLLNIASMALGGYPDSIPRHDLIPGLTRDPGSVFPVFSNIAASVGVAVTGRAGGLSVEDFNRDGFLDLLMTSWGLADPMHLFLADGKGGYYDHTSAAGLDGITGGLNTVHADYDNDGYDDVFVLRGAWLGDAGAYPNSLLHNKGDGTFEDVTYDSGVLSFHPTHSAAWGDFNLDGRLDLFVGNESQLKLGGGSHRSELFVNNGDGTFREISHQAGIDLDEFVKGVVWGDVNNDGLPDLFASVLGGPNKLYINLGGSSVDRWRFEERAAAAGVEQPIYSFPTWFWDVDQDGWEDLLVLSYDLRHGTAVHEAVAREYLGLPATIVHNGVPIEVEHSRLYHNNGNGTFSDVTKQAGLDKVLFAMGSNFGDLDNDGWLDFYVGTGNPDLRSVVPNRMFRNVDGHRFEEVTMAGGFGHIQKGHAPAFVDLDRDGDEDIYMVLGGAYEGDRFSNLLFENPGWPVNRWVTLELEGKTANRSAIGARVALVVTEAGGGSRTLHRTVGTGGSFGAGSLQLHVGLGRAGSLQRVDVAWPDASRSRTSYTGLELNQTYHIVQGASPVLLQRPAVGFRKGAADPHAGHDLKP